MNQFKKYWKNCSTFSKLGFIFAIVIMCCYTPIGLFSSEKESISPKTIIQTPTIKTTYSPSPILELDYCVPKNTKIETGIVTNIVDGDTIDVLIDGETYRVRYIGIDTPEMSDKNGQEAKEVNSKLVLGQIVTLIKDVSEIDRYDRLLRYVFFNNDFINYLLIANGYALTATYPPDISCAEFFETAQENAIDSQVGFWNIEETPTVISTIYEFTSTVVVSETDGENIKIINIFYDGANGKNEPDEYVEIKNISSNTIDISGWTLLDDQNHVFQFYQNTTIQPEQICRIYTHEYHEEYCGFTFESNLAIWNNSGDVAYLYNIAGELIDKYSYQ